MRPLLGLFWQKYCRCLVVQKKSYFSLVFVTEVSKMDPSYYSPQPTSSRVHAVCYCRVHGNSAQMSPRNYPHPHQLYNPQHFDPGSRLSIDPPSPVTRQLMQKHPEAVVIHSGKLGSCVDPNWRRQFVQALNCVINAFQVKRLNMFLVRLSTIILLFTDKWYIKPLTAQQPSHDPDGKKRAKIPNVCKNPKGINPNPENLKPTNLISPHLQAPSEHLKRPF